jgi:hypothetical protein
MFRLMTQNYVNVRRQQFETDLDTKSWVILVHLPSSRSIVGFSTQVILQEQIAGDPIRALYSGDTVVDREHWGDPALAHAWGNFALQLMDRYSDRPLYWFLTSKGFRTYRYLPLFFRNYLPRPGISGAPLEQVLVDVLGSKFGGTNYDPAGKIIRAIADKEFVRPDLGQPGTRCRTDPHVRFFVERNPGFHRGDELCCLAPLTRDNFTRAAYRVIENRTQSVSCG